MRMLCNDMASVCYVLAGDDYMAKPLSLSVLLKKIDDRD